MPTKIILEFDNIQDAQIAINGLKYLSALQDMDNYLRNQCKYNDLREDVHDAINAARDNLSECCDGFNLWD